MSEGKANVWECLKRQYYQQQCSTNWKIKIHVGHNMRHQWDILEWARWHQESRVQLITSTQTKNNIPYITRRNKNATCAFLFQSRKKELGATKENGAGGLKAPLRSCSHVSVIVLLSHTVACALHTHESRSNGKFYKMPRPYYIAGCLNGVRRSSNSRRSKETNVTF